MVIQEITSFQILELMRVFLIHKKQLKLPRNKSKNHSQPLSIIKKSQGIQRFQETISFQILELMRISLASIKPSKYLRNRSSIHGHQSSTRIKNTGRICQQPLLIPAIPISHLHKHLQKIPRLLFLQTEIFKKICADYNYLSLKHHHLFFKIKRKRIF